MSDLAVIVPTRGRPQNVRRLMEGWAVTQAIATLWLGVDDDDETVDLAMFSAWAEEFDVDLRVTSLLRSNMCGTLNAVALRASVEYVAIGFMGDDHLPRTSRWDTLILEALSDRPAIAYGNDLMHGPNLPTAVFMTADITRALGYFAPPQMDHLFLDNAWRDWGQGTKRFHYLPDVVIEHLHPQAGKAEWDENYGRVNAGAMWEHDSGAYRTYCDGQRALDLAKLRSLV